MPDKDDSQDVCIEEGDTFDVTVHLKGLRACKIEKAIMDKLRVGVRKLAEKTIKRKPLEVGDIKANSSTILELEDKLHWKEVRANYLTKELKRITGIAEEALDGWSEDAKHLGMDATQTHILALEKKIWRETDAG